MRLSLLALGFFCICVIITSSEAQLNFSTGWGKRSQNPSAVSSSIRADDDDRPRAFRLQPDVDMFLRYYRRLRKIEAQQLANSQE